MQRPRKHIKLCKERLELTNKLREADASLKEHLDGLTTTAYISLVVTTNPKFMGHELSVHVNAVIYGGNIARFTIHPMPPELTYIPDIQYYIPEYWKKIVSIEQDYDRLGDVRTLCKSELYANKLLKWAADGRRLPGQKGELPAPLYVDIINDRVLAFLGVPLATINNNDMQRGPRIKAVEILF